MREYKFRGKRVDDGKWVTGSLLVDLDNSCFIVNDLKTIRSVEDVIPEAVGQFTGLKDKNGKGIYVGDVVKSQYFRASEVIFNNGCFMATDITFPDAESTYPDIEWEVIGNIYDNPDLMQKD